MSKRRVVITGLGMLSPLGNTVEDSWKGVVEGRSGISTITRFDTENFGVKIGGQISGLELDNYIDPKEARRMDAFMQYGMVASIQAINDAGISDLSPEKKSRVGVAFGSGIGGIETIESVRDTYVKSGTRRVSPFFVPSSIINMIAGHLSIMYGLKGPNISIVTACTSGVHNIGHAARMIAYGDADAMVAGGAEKASTKMGMGGFGAARALSTRNDAPELASRPWDKDRDGFVLGDGAGVLVLEEYETAKARGAKIYAELVGFGMSGDAYHMTSPPADGDGAARSMQNAINDAKIDVANIGYVNAHGTSTPAGDIAETNAVKTVFGDHAYKTMVGSTKSMTGHLLGAAGSVEAIFTIQALVNNQVPPTINLDNPDEGCDLDYIRGQARDVSLEYGLCNSFGFGGTNGSLLFKKI